MKSTKTIYIVGGGHAGSSAALAAARAKIDLKTGNSIEIHLLDKNPYLTIKPRLYEYELNETTVPYSKFLPPSGVYFHQDEVGEIDLDNQRIIGKTKTYHFDALILSTGSGVGQPDKAFSLNNYQAAKTLQEQIFKRIDANAETINIAVLGGGFTGIELATELPRNIRKYCREINHPIPEYTITLFDHGEVGASLGENPKNVIIEALEVAGIHKMPFVDITDFNKNEVHFTDQEEKKQVEKFDIVANTLGQKTGHLVGDLNFPEDKSGRVKVNSHLQIPNFTSVLLAGDVASVLVDEENLALMTCQQGRPQGRFAGYNAVALLSDHSLADYEQPFYLTCLDLGDYGAVYTEGWDRHVIFKGPEAKKYKKHINRERIYPPVSGAKDDLYQAGKLVFETPRKTIIHSKFK